MEQETCYHKYQSTHLNSIVVVPAKEITAYEQNSAQDHYDGSQILFKAVHCYVVLFVFFDCKLNGFYPKNETIVPFMFFVISEK